MLGWEFDFKPPSVGAGIFPALHVDFIHDDPFLWCCNKDVLCDHLLLEAPAFRFKVWLAVCGRWFPPPIFLRLCGGDGGAAAAETQNNECVCVSESERGGKILTAYTHTHTRDLTETWKSTLG